MLTDTPTYRGLLAAILQNPADDTPRLALADYLDETGQDAERAEFIRVQCALAECRRDRCSSSPLRDIPDELFEHPAYVDGKPTRCGKCRWCLLKQREKELIGRLPFSTQRLDRGMVWRRGFIEEVRLLGVEWVKAAPTLLAAYPVQTVTLLSLPSVTRGPHPSRLYLDGTGIWAWRDELDHYSLATEPFSISGQAVPSLLLHRGWPTIRFQGQGMLQSQELQRFRLGPPDYLLDHARKLHPVPTALPWRVYKGIRARPENRRILLHCDCRFRVNGRDELPEWIVRSSPEVCLERVELWQNQPKRHPSEPSNLHVTRFVHYLGQCPQCKTVYWTENVMNPKRTATPRTGLK